MNARQRLARPALLVAVFTLSLMALGGVRGVPFHPDESSWLYMSRDFELWLTRPLSLAWRAELEGDYDQTYRELNAPLAKYLLGLSRALAGVPSSQVSVDWDWTQGWDQNVSRGALPSALALWSARWSVTLLMPFSLALTYRTARRLGGAAHAWLATLLLGVNSLVLLHGRRAMAEGPLVLGITLSMWGLLVAHRRPWLAGLGIALAISAKQSALVLFPVGVLAAIWMPPPARAAAGNIARGLIQFLAAFVAVVLILHPLYWAEPLSALRATVMSRQLLLDRQVSELGALQPAQVQRTPAERAAVNLAQLFVNPPQIKEVGNYAAQTAAAEAAYLANPVHRLLRGWIAGGALMTLTVFGLAAGGLRARRSRPAQRRRLILIGVATLSQAALLVVSVPLPFQRYVIPLAPFVCLWAAYGLGELLQSIAAARRKAVLVG